MNDTVKAHNIGSAIVRIDQRKNSKETAHNKAIAISCDCTPRYVAANPF